MSYTCHHAIVVTGPMLVDEPQKSALDRTHAKAVELFGVMVSPIVGSAINGFRSFFVAPDGSGEGWKESDACDEKRAELIAFMDAERYSDGSSPIAWVEVQFHDDDGDNRITAHVDERPRELAHWTDEDRPEA